MIMGKARTLKAALQLQQSRLKTKRKITHSGQISKLNMESSARIRSKLGPDLKGKGRALPVLSSGKRTIPFCHTDKILLIGEGNFSFAHALVVHPPPELQSFPPRNLTATSYDSEEDCYRKYPDAYDIVSTLRGRGVEVLFGVDGTRLEKTPKLKRRRWDRVVWNFPHAGRGITDQDRNILSNQMLILGFLRSVSNVLRLGWMPSSGSKTHKKGTNDSDEDEAVVEKVDVSKMPSDGEKARGTVLITLRNVPPYTSWDITRLAKKPPILGSGSTPPNPRYIILRSFRFDRGAYMGYMHQMTKGTRFHGTGTTGEGGEDRTWEFCLKDGDD